MRRSSLARKPRLIKNMCRRGVDRGTETGEQNPIITQSPPTSMTSIPHHKEKTPQRDREREKDSKKRKKEEIIEVRE